MDVIEKTLKRTGFPTQKKKDSFTNEVTKVLSKIKSHTGGTLADIVDLKGATNKKVETLQQRMLSVIAPSTPTTPNSGPGTESGSSSASDSKRVSLVVSSKPTHVAVSMPGFLPNMTRATSIKSSISTRVSTAIRSKHDEDRSFSPKPSIQKSAQEERKATSTSLSLASNRKRTDASSEGTSEKSEIPTPKYTNIYSRRKPAPAPVKQTKVRTKIVRLNKRQQHPKDSNVNDPSPMSVSQQKTMDRLEQKNEENDLRIPSHRIRYLANQTHFSEEEVIGLQKLFHAYTTNNALSTNESKAGHGHGNAMNRVMFREFFRLTFGITDDIMLDQVFRFFDVDRVGLIDEMDWIRNLSIILRGSLEEHIKYCFQIYDINGDGGIEKEELMNLMHGCVVPMHRVGVETEPETESPVNDIDIVDIVLTKISSAKNGQISLHNFRRAVQNNPLFLEAIGNCLPEADKVLCFMALFCENYYNFTTNLSSHNDRRYVKRSGSSLSENTHTHHDHDDHEQ